MPICTVTCSISLAQPNEHLRLPQSSICTLAWCGRGSCCQSCAAPYCPLRLMSSTASQVSVAAAAFCQSAGQASCCWVAAGAAATAAGSSGQGRWAGLPADGCSPAGAAAEVGRVALLLLLPLRCGASAEIPPKRFSGSCSCGRVPAVPRGLRGSGATPGSTPAAVGLCIT